MEPTTALDTAAIATQITGLVDTVATLAPAMLGVGIAVVGVLIAKKMIFGSK